MKELEEFVMKRMLKILIVFFISLQFAIAQNVSSKDPLNLFFIQEVGTGQLALKSDNTGALIVKVSDKPLISFNANSQQKLTGFIELPVFFKAIKKKFKDKSFNAALILDKQNDPTHKNIYIVALSNPQYNSSAHELKYNILLLTHRANKESKKVAFNNGVLLYDQVCISCYFGD